MPVVPVGIVGTFSALPAGYHWPRRAQVEVRFGVPMFTSDGERPQPGPAGLRAATERIMASIQSLSGQELAADATRGSSPISTGPAS